MRSKAIFMALLALAFQAQADFVSSSDATAAANAWASRGRHLGLYLGQRAVGPAAVHTTSARKSFYSVKLSGGGTVFLSGDTEAEPIIAFTSDPSDFTTIDPKSPLWALLDRDLSQRQGAVPARAFAAAPTVAYAQALTSRATNVRKWRALLDEAANLSVRRFGLLAAPLESEPGDLRVSALMRTKWSQSGGVWNYYTPPGKDHYTSENAVCGCVATAASQIMRYLHGTPDEEGAGGLEIPFPLETVEQKTFKCSYRGKELNLTMQGGTYCWTNMPFTQGEIQNEGQKQNIGKLTSDVGIAVNMMYDMTDGKGSGAVTGTVPTRWREVFGYRQASWIGSVDVEDESGQAILRNALFANFDARRPCLMSIPGHAIVADGYGFEEDVPYVHLNMGWAGSNDLWYNLPDMTKANPEFTAVDGIGYNIFPDVGGVVETETTHGIISGRVLDEDGLPVSECAVTITGGEGVATNLLTDARGVWAAIVPAGTYDAVAATDDGVWIGVAEGVIVCAPGVEVTADAVGNAWGNDIVLEHPSVRLNGLETEIFSSVDRAIMRAREIAAENPSVPVTFEILDRTLLKRKAIVDFDCLFVATNACAAETSVDCLNDAMLVVTNGMAFFSNVVFSATNRTVVSVKAPGQIKVAGTASFGELVLGAPHIACDAASCFVLGGRLENAIVLSCEGAEQQDYKFGAYDCDAETAAESAGRLVCATDLTLAGVSGAGNLRWSAGVPVDPLTAVAYVDGLGVGEDAYYRELDRLFDDFPQGTNVVIVRPGGVLRQPRVFGSDYSIGTTGDVVAVSVEAVSAFRITNGTLTVSGLAFENFKGVGLLLAEGTNAALSVVDTTFRNVEGVTNHSGAVAALAGASLRVDGGLFDGCQATGKFAANRNPVKSYGGAITVRGGGSVELIATNAPLTIVNCEASTAGGGVYVEGVTNHACVVSVAGALTVRDNVCRATGVALANDMYLCDSNVLLTCVGDLTAGPRTIGLTQFRKKGGEALVKGDVFAQFDAASLSASVETGKAFFHDANENLFARVGGEGDSPVFVWDDVPDYRVPEELAEELAVCEVSGCGEKADGYYASFADAVRAIDGDATLTLLKDVEFGDPLTVGHRVTILSDASLPAPCCVTRTQDVSIDVTGSLTLTNVTFDGGDVVGGGRLFTVCGGTMTLQSGATVCNVRGGRTRASGAIAVNGGGTFEMESGAEIFGCVNDYENAGTLSGYGGALLVEDGSKAFLRGGTIRGCQAYSAGGVFIGTRSTVRLSGDIQIVNNTSLDGEPSNLSVSDDSTLILAGDTTFAGAAGVTTAYQADTNVFGRVENLPGDVQAAAHAFTNDVTRDVGMAVVSGSETLLVWSAALNEEGQYVDADGNEYELVDGASAAIDEPQVEIGLVYDGIEKVGLKEGVGYSRASGYVGTNAGPYQATATLRPGFVWKSTGGTDDWSGSWSIAKGTLRITDYVSFTSVTNVYDEQPKTIAISGELPVGVSVTYSYPNGEPWPEKGVWQVGEHEIVATFACDNANYELVPSSLTATLTIKKLDPPDPPPGPTPEIVDPDPVAFTSIEKVDDEWVLVATNAKQWCEYSLWCGTTLKTNEWTTPVVDWTQWTEPDGPITNRVTVSDDVQRFWILKARPGEKPVE